MYKEIEPNFYDQTQEWLNETLNPYNKELFHYTSVESLKSIIENNCLFATHINFLNDWREYTAGYQLLTSHVKAVLEKYSDDMNGIISLDNDVLTKIKGYINDKCPDITTYNEQHLTDKFSEFRQLALPEVYTISFCTKCDLLNQWAIYAKESGVAIEFDFRQTVFTDAELSDKKKEDYADQDWNKIKYFPENKPHEISYDEKSMEKAIDNLINEVILRYKNGSPNKNEVAPVIPLLRNVLQLYSLVPYIKTKDFNVENEARLAFMRRLQYLDGEKTKKKGLYQSDVLYRIANNVLKPYIKIGWETSNYPIKKIIVGPGENQDAVYKGIIHFIENQPNSIIPNIKHKQPFSEHSLDNKHYRTCQGIMIEKSDISYIF